MPLEDQLVHEIRSAVIDDNLSRYIALMRSNPAQVNASHWRQFIGIIQNSQTEDNVCEVFRQIMVDVLANTLAVLDGSSNLETLRGNFRVSYEGTFLPQTLADTLWEQEQANI
jgi:hypothetical protein